MASFNIHIAVAKLYAARTGAIKDLGAFYKGTVDPDLTDNKESTHYGYDPGPFEKNAWLCFGYKVGLSKYFKTHDLDNDYNLGYFLHLVVDVKFFHEFFNEEYLSKQDTDIFKANIYHSYGLVNPHLVKQYGLDEIDMGKIMDMPYITKKVEQSRKKIERVQQEENHTAVCILDIARLDAFITEVAGLDLQSIAAHARKSSS